MKELLQASELYSVYLWWTVSLQLAHRNQGWSILDTNLSLQDKEMGVHKERCVLLMQDLSVMTADVTPAHVCTCLLTSRGLCSHAPHELMIANSSIWAAMAIANNGALRGWSVVPHSVAGVMLFTEWPLQQVSLSLCCRVVCSACEENMFLHDMNAPCVRHWLICKLNIRPAWTRQTPQQPLVIANSAQYHHTVCEQPCVYGI